MRFRISLLLSISLVSIKLLAQKDTLLITPENGLLDGSHIEAYTNRWKVTLIKSDGARIPNKVWTDYSHILELDGKPYLHRVQDLYDPEMNHLDTWINVVSVENLAPWRSATLKPGGLFSYVDYHNNTAELRTNTTSPDSSITVSGNDFGQKVYDWSLYGILLVGLPFERDLIAKLPIVGTDGVQWLHAHVSDQETIKLPNEVEIQTWKIITNQKLVFWVSQTAPYVIKLELTLPKDDLLIWEMF